MLTITGKENRKPTGGIKNHRPDCGCPPCRRNRAKETQSGPTGSPQSPDAPEGVTEALTLAEDGLTVIPQALEADVEPARAPRAPNYKDKSIRARVADWIRYRAIEPGISNAEVARRLGISPGTLNSYIYKANKEGWLKFDDPMLELEHQILPKITRNLNQLLDNKESCKGSEKVTIEAAKGVLFPLFNATKGVSNAPTTIIALKLEMPGDDAPKLTGTIKGKAKSLAALEGEIIE